MVTQNPDITCSTTSSRPLHTVGRAVFWALRPTTSRSVDRRTLALVHSFIDSSVIRTVPPSAFEITPPCLHKTTPFFYLSSSPFFTPAGAAVRGARTYAAHAARVDDGSRRQLPCEKGGVTVASELKVGRSRTPLRHSETSKVGRSTPVLGHRGRLGSATT